jgi:hypothetical protein
MGQILNLAGCDSISLVMDFIILLSYFGRQKALVKLRGCLGHLRDFICQSLYAKVVDNQVFYPLVMSRIFQCTVIYLRQREGAVLLSQLVASW